LHEEAFIAIEKIEIIQDLLAETHIKAIVNAFTNKYTMRSKIYKRFLSFFFDLLVKQETPILIELLL